MSFAALHAALMYPPPEQEVEQLEVTVFAVGVHTDAAYSPTPGAEQGMHGALPLEL